ncbi:MAG: class I SAM-dependent methyltransferase [Candidatus Omnitrophica bacterium]|nr:class I SAM-dependent methyltransferase [Candidatus Omnitrophota bacterium]MDD5352367.1 class I SAM-dependent methyltransferase [Candidatus Omnitrophota bacterium]MDD5549965.1 class I SAM-dependent methyltransferase [Candidatus Omnitrophota bacterium]
MDIINQSKNIYKKPDCHLTDRFMMAINELNDGDNVLEIGVGWGELARNVDRYKKISLFVIDAAESALNKISSYVKDSQLADISNEKIKFRDNQFDKVVCLEVFEHLQNPYHALTEIQRVLKPGGKLILSIPNYLGGHLMIYPGLITPKFFRIFLRQNYFKINKFYVWGPVLNTDNIGKLIEAKLKNKIISLILLRLIQVIIRAVQFITRLLFLKITSLYWCYVFVCENKKDAMDTPLWLKQLEQTSEIKGNIGWYHSYFHKKV